MGDVPTGEEVEEVVDARSLGSRFSMRVRIMVLGSSFWVLAFLVFQRSREISPGLVDPVLLFGVGLICSLLLILSLGPFQVHLDVGGKGKLVVGKRLGWVLVSVLVSLLILFFCLNNRSMFVLGFFLCLFSILCFL